MKRKPSQDQSASDDQSKQKAQEKIDTDRKQLLESLKQFSERAIKIQEACDNEEQTKVSLVNPYIEMLGYDVRDPLMVRLEYTSDIGKHGEKVDYAILRDGKPTILIEAKSAGTHFDRGKAPTQLQRYFMASEAELAALTNGLVWHWYRATPGSYKLESAPFLSHDVRKPIPHELDWLLHVSEPHFDPKKTRYQAEEQMVTSKSLEWIEGVRKGPTDEFIRFLIREQGIGRASSHMVNTTRNVFRRVFNNYIDQKADELLARARNLTEEKEQNGEEKTEQKEVTASVSNKKTSSAEAIFLDTQDGQPLMSSLERPRAWRVRGEHWRRERHSKDLQLSVIRHLASHDVRGDKKFFRESVDGETFFQQNPALILNRCTEIIPGVWHWTSLSNIKRKIVLSAVANLVRTSDGRKIRVSDDSSADIQVWLPTGK